MRIILCFALALTALAQAPKTGKVDLFPLEQVKPGMKATAWTVFEGQEVEPVPVEVIGEPLTERNDGAVRATLETVPPPAALTAAVTNAYSWRNSGRKASATSPSRT